LLDQRGNAVEARAGEVVFTGGNGRAFRLPVIRHGLLAHADFGGFRTCGGGGHRIRIGLGGCGRSLLRKALERLAVIGDQEIACTREQQHDGGQRSDEPAGTPGTPVSLNFGNLGSRPNARILALESGAGLAGWRISAASGGAGRKWA
jgi:hypothetical protein